MTDKDASGLVVLSRGVAQALFSYGCIHPVTGVVYGGMTHEEAIDRLGAAMAPGAATLIASQAEEIKRLREALKPFAFDGLEWKHGDTVTTSMAIRDIYRARTALNGDQP